MNAWLVWRFTPGASAVAAMVVLAAALAVAHYARSGARWPAVLRGLALLMLAATALRPSLRYVEPASSARPLRVVLDDSLSMNSVDTRKAGDRLRLAAVFDGYDDPDWPRPDADADRLRGTLDALRRAGEALASARQVDAVAAPQRLALSRMRNTALADIDLLLDSAERAGCATETLEKIREAEQIVTNNGEAAAALRAIESILRDARETVVEAADRQPDFVTGIADVYENVSRTDLAAEPLRR